MSNILLEKIASSKRAADTAVAFGNEIIESVRLNNETNREAIGVIKDIREGMSEFRPLLKQISSYMEESFEEYKRRESLNTRQMELKSKIRETELEIELCRKQKELEELKKSMEKSED